MRRIHSIYDVCGHKTFVKVEEPSWNYLVVSFIITKRKGQTVKATFRESPNILFKEVNNLSNYAKIRLITRKENYDSKRSCIAYCNGIITSITKHVNFDSDMKLITKELLNLLK